MKPHFYNEYKYEIYDSLSFNSGDHICSLYEKDEDAINTIVEYIKDALTRKEKVIYITDEAEKKQILNQISTQMQDIHSFIARGDVELLTDREPYLTNGDFSADKMINFLKKASTKSIESGYEGFRAAGNMSWALESLKSLNALLEYEVRLNNELFGHHKCIGLCLYDMRRFPAEILSSQIDNHTLCHIGKELYPNQFYIPPEAYLSKDKHSFILSHKLHQIKERKKREKTVAYLFRQTEELKEISHMLVHDLKGPLNTAAMMTTMLKEEFSIDSLNRAIAALKKASDRLIGIEHINNVTFPHSPLLSLNLNVFFQKLRSNYEEKIKSVGGSITISKSAPVTLSIDDTHLLQIFSNLINNAIKFRQKNNLLYINISTYLIGEDEVKIIVEDNGIGFSPDLAKKVFQPFFRDPNISHIEGTGIGLTICHRIMQKYNGYIAVNSQEGLGSRFELTFPLVS